MLQPVALFYDLRCHQTQIVKTKKFNHTDDQLKLLTKPVNAKEGLFGSVP